MSETYEGPITVSLDDGRHIEGAADLTASYDGSMKTWEGTITFDTPTTAQTVFREEKLDLIMPDGRAGEALARTVDFPDPYIGILGTGPAPWDTGL